MPRRSSKMLPLVLSLGVALAMAGCQDRDDPNAPKVGSDVAADTTPSSTADTRYPPNDANAPPAADATAGAMDARSSGTDQAGMAPMGSDPNGAGPAGGDQAFVRTALADGMAEVSMSRYAASKAKSKEVRALATRIADDHEALNAKLRAAAGSSADAVQMDDAAKSAESMVRASEGAELDKAYLRHMADDHKQGIARFEAAAAQSTDPAVRKLAEDALPKLREHAKLVEARLAATR